MGPAISGLQALSDDDSVQGLIEELGELTDVQIPGLGNLQQLLP